MSQEDDLRLLRACLDVRPGSWESFVERFAPYLAEVCRRTLRRSGRPSGPQEASDMLQEVFLHFLARDLKALKDYQGRSTVAAYLSAVAVCRVLKDRSLRPHPVEKAPREAFAGPGPAEALEARDSHELLRREMERLPHRDRVALSLRADGASLREIGRALGISEPATAKLLSRARGLLRGRLE